MTFRIPSSFDALDRVIKQHFHNPDLKSIRIVLGIIRAHQLNIGEPPWLFVIAIMGSAGLPSVQVLGDLTPNTLNSGFYGADRPGLLEKLGEVEETDDGRFQVEGNGILLLKDFTTALTMRREKRAKIMAQFRQIYDGSFRKDFGAGQSKTWRGKITGVAAVTPAIDDHSGAMAALGERFLRVRIARPDSEAGIRAIGSTGKRKDHRKAAREGGQASLRWRDVSRFPRSQERLPGRG